MMPIRSITLLGFMMLLFMFTPKTIAREWADISSDEKRQLFRSCINAASRERCEARQRSRWEWQESHKPDTALETYDGMDMGQARLRRKLQRERATENKRQWTTTRKTYRQLEPTDDVNTQRRPFINEYRQKRLQCMTDAISPRQLGICLDNLGNAQRDEMKKAPLGLKKTAE